MPWPPFFTRRSKPSETPPAVTPPAAEVWRSGDLAECIHAGPWHCVCGKHDCGQGPKLGERLVVGSVTVVSVPPVPGSLQFLCFARYGTNGFSSTCFRKIIPQADAAIAVAAATLDELLSVPAVPQELVQ